MTTSEGTPTAGGRALRRFLDERSVSIAAFCKAHDLDRITVQRLLRGERDTRVSALVATKIQRATEGAVTVEMWLPAAEPKTKTRRRKPEARVA